MAALLNAKIILLVAAVLAVLTAIALDMRKVAVAVAPPPPAVEKVKPMRLSGMEKTLFDKEMK